jgi:general secretion pathway protein L
MRSVPLTGRNRPRARAFYNVDHSMSALIVLLPLQPASASAEFDYAVTADGSALESHGSAQAAVLPRPDRAGTEVVAVVPACMLSWHRLELPKGATAGSPRLRAILDGLLEDQLLDEPENLHFALPPQARPGAPIWIAACDRAWLRGALTVLEAAERQVTRIVPEFAPEGETALYAMGDPQQPLLVAAGSNGVMTLPLTAQVLPVLPQLPESTPLVAEPAVAALAEQILHRQPQLQQAPQRWVQAAQSPWDLAQFEFSSSGRTRALKKLGTAWSDVARAPQWRAARWGAGLLVALNLLGLNAWALRERSVLSQKREAIHQTLTQTFPQVKVVVDAPVQMDKEVAALRQSTGAVSGRDLEAMLGALAKSLPSPRAISGLEFNGSELRLRGLGVAPQEVEALNASLKSQGYRATAQGDTLVITPEANP